MTSLRASSRDPAASTPNVTDRVLELSRRLGALPLAKRERMMQLLAREGVDLGSIPVPARSAEKLRETRRGPLSFAQERLRLQHALRPGNPRLNLFGAFRLTGKLSLPALREAFSLLVERHETLRTSVNESGERAWQEIHAATEVRLPDLQEPRLLAATRLGLPADADSGSVVEAMALREASTPFELSCPPLWRLGLARLACEEHVLVLTFHHLIADAWSLKVLVQELGQVYRSAVHQLDAVDGEAPAAPPSTPASQPGRPQYLDGGDAVQYADFACWQRQWLTSQWADAQLSYWVRQLEGAETSLSLPADFHHAAPGPAQAAQPEHFDGRLQRLVLPAALSERVRQEARQLGATPYMVLLACYQLLLHRLSGQRDLCVGSSVAQRPRPELEHSVGFFVNLVVLRSRVDDGTTVAELLAETRRTVLAALDHQDVPFERVVQALRPERASGEQPLFQALFVMQNAPRVEAELPGLTLTRVELERRFARYLLSLRVTPRSDGRLALAFEYSVSHWNSTTAVTVLKQYADLLARMLAQPRRRVSELGWFEPLAQVAPAETSSAYASLEEPALRLEERFARMAERYPARVALQTPERSVSYAELNQASTRVAVKLCEHGVSVEERVAVCFDPGIRFIEVLLGVLKAGAAFVPLEAEWPEARIETLARASGARWLLRPALEHEAGDGGIRVRAIASDDGRRHAGENHSQAQRQRALSVRQLAYVMFTSGSAGRPKGVAVTHASVSAYADAAWKRFDLPEPARLLWASGIAADLGYTSVWCALCTGQTLLVADRGLALDAERLAAWLDAEPALLAKFAPSQLAALLQSSERPAALLPQGLLLVGGEAASPELLGTVHRLAPRLRVLNHYGPTEATIGVLTHELGSAELREGVPPALGRAWEHVRACVLDRALQPVPEGIWGELCLGGDCLARGYDSEPAQTARSFVPDPSAGESGIEPGARLYRTGDRVRYRNGRFEFDGRIDAQLNLHGYRSEPREIECCLEQQPEVTAAKVLLCPRDGSPQLVAFVCGSSRALDGMALRAALKNSLPAHMVPSLCLVLEALPLLSNGKLDQATLQRLAREAQRPAGQACGELSSTERALCRVWQSVLKLEQLGVEDDFFSLGGDSILALQIVARARRDGLVLTPKQLFDRPTVRGLAALMDGAGVAPDAQEAVTQSEPASASAAASAVATSAAVATVRGLEREDRSSLPLTPIQRWFFEASMPNPGHYNQSLLLAVPPVLNPAQLQKALAGLRERHDALRLRFVVRADGWSAEHDRAASELRPALTRLARDVSGQDAAAQESTWIERECAAFQAGFVLNQGPLLRALYLDCGPKRLGRLLLVAHHLVIDGVSWRIVLEDLDALYHGRPLGSATTSYQQWAHVLQEHARAPERAEELAFWREQPLPTALPRDHSGLNSHASLAEVSRTLSPDRTSRLLRVTANERVRVDSALLSAALPSLARWSGEPGVVVDCEGHGRDDLGRGLDLSRSVGWFTSRFPVHFELAGEASPSEALRSAHASLAAVPAGGLGYGLLRYMSPHGAELRQRPVPEFSFNYLGQVDRGLQPGLWRTDARVCESAGPQHDPQSARRHTLALHAHIKAGRLHTNWLYSHSLHRRATVERLANETLAALERLADPRGGIPRAAAVDQAAADSDFDHLFEAEGR